MEWQQLLLEFRKSLGDPIVALGYIFCFALSFSIGANDAANQWGTSVGAKVISDKWMYFLGSIMEIIGATFLSENVIKKIVHGIIDISQYESCPGTDNLNITECIVERKENDEDWEILQDEKKLILGCLSVMIGSALWEIFASALRWPVSSSHSIIASLLGFTMVAKGKKGIKGMQEFGLVILGWLLSPVIAFILTFLFYLLIDRLCISNSSDKLKKIFYSVIVWFAFGFNVFNIMITGNLFNQVSLWCNGLISETSFDSNQVFLNMSNIRASLGRRHLEREADFNHTSSHHGLIHLAYLQSLSNETSDSLESDGCSECDKGYLCFFVISFMVTMPLAIVFFTHLYDKFLTMEGTMSLNWNPCSRQRHECESYNETSQENPGEKLFRPLLILSACTGSLAHGGNDVGNCVGPLVIISYILRDGVIKWDSSAVTDMSRESWALALYGGIGMSVGLTVFGKRVIKTMSDEINTQPTSASGFCAEMMTAATVLIFSNNSKLAVPISTTHCQVGALVGVSLSRGFLDKGLRREALANVDFKKLGIIFGSWVATIPFTMVITAVFYFIIALCFGVESISSEGTSDASYSNIMIDI